MNTNKNPRGFFYCIRPIIIYFVVNYLVMFAFVIFVSLNNGGLPAESEQIYDFLLENMLKYSVQISLVSALIIIVICFLKFKKAEKTEFDDKYYNYFSVKAFCYALFTGVGVYLFVDIVITMLGGIFDMSALMQQHNETMQLLDTGELVMDMILLGVISPISEELLFRGLVFNRLRIQISESVAIGLSAAVFASMHFSSFIQMCYAFFLGYVLAYCYVKFENILVPIIIHSAFNMTNYIFYIKPLNDFLNTKPGMLIYYFFAVGLSCVMFKVMKNRTKPLHKIEQLEK